MFRLAPRILATLVLGASLALASLGSAAAQQSREFTVWNRTDVIFAQLFVSPTTTTDWGDDYLGSQILSPGDGWKLTFTKYVGGQCLYDVKVVGKAGEEGKLIGVDLCKVDTITFSPTVASPRELLEKWLGATAELGKIGIDPSNATADYETSADGATTTLFLRPKDTTSQSGINIAIGQFNSAETSRATVAGIADQRKAEGWTVDTATPPSLGDRAFLMGGKSDGTLITLFFVVQVFDRAAVVSVTGAAASTDALAEASSSLIVDLLKTLDPTVK